MNNDKIDLLGDLFVVFFLYKYMHVSVCILKLNPLQFFFYIIEYTFVTVAVMIVNIQTF